MSREAAPERVEMALIVNRLIGTLTHVHDGLAVPPHYGAAWGDEEHLYLETTLPPDGDPACLDLCLHGGRLFLSVAR